MAPADQERHLRDSGQTHTQTQTHGQTHTLSAQAPHPHQHQQTPANSVNAHPKVVAKPRFEKGFSFTDSNAPSTKQISPPPVHTDQALDAVTPGIELATYRQWPDARADSPSYFSHADPKIRTSPHQESHRRIPPLGQTSATMNRRESLSEIRAANPDLSLSGNIISATFTPTHAFTYRKGGQWVSALASQASTLPRGDAATLRKQEQAFSNNP